MNEILSKSYYDPKFESQAYVVHPGSYYTSSDPELMIVTILGSCVAACIHDPIAKIGGLNHFMLPSAPNNSVLNSESNRYGSYAMEKLINEILSKGGKRENLGIKLFGGAAVIKNSMQIGESNIQFVHQYLTREGLKITSEDLGGSQARRIHFWPATGKVLRLCIAKDNRQVVEHEDRYRDQILPEKKIGGDVELF